MSLKKALIAFICLVVKSAVLTLYLSHGSQLGCGMVAATLRNMVHWLMPTCPRQFPDSCHFPLMFVCSSLARVYIMFSPSVFIGLGKWNLMFVDFIFLIAGFSIKGTSWHWICHIWAPRYSMISLYRESTVLENQERGLLIRVPMTRIDNMIILSMAKYTWAGTHAS